MTNSSYITIQIKLPYITKIASDRLFPTPYLYFLLFRPVLLVGRDNSAMILPRAALTHLQETGMPSLFVVTERDSVMAGHKVTIDNEGVSLAPVWSLNTPGDSIVTIRPRKPDEVVHSAGRVLNDRSV